MPGPGYISSNSAEIKTALDEEDTVFLVLADGDEAKAQSIYDDSLVVIDHNNPQVWRVLWVKDPGQLDQQLSSLFWPGGVQEAIVLSLGTGLQREVKETYEFDDLSDEFEIFKAFSEG